MSAYPPPPGYGAYPGPQYYAKSQAQTALVLGILGLVVCTILAPIAWGIGNTEIKEIDAGRRDPANRSTANTGKVLGIIGTVFLIIGAVVVIALIATGVILSGSSSY